MATPAPDIRHPLYREALAPFAAGARDVLGAMLLAGGLELGDSQPLIGGPADLSAVAVGGVAFPFQISGTVSVQGAILLSGDALPALVGGLLGEATVPVQLDEFHVPMLRDALSNVLGRWVATLSESRGWPRLEVQVEAQSDPLAPLEVLASGPLSHQPQVAIETHPFQFGGSAGALSLAFPPAAVVQLIASHPAYTPPVEAPPVSDPMTPPAPAPAPFVQDPPSVSRAQFQPLDERSRGSGEPRHLDLLRDVPLTITVELGKKDLTIKDILELSPGALIELDRLAGEPLDLLINGQLFAKGKVVVIDESFGMRITSIVSPEERLQSLR